jgi:hypothetical protein
MRSRSPAATLSTAGNAVNARYALSTAKKSVVRQTVAEHSSPCGVPFRVGEP